MKRTAPLALAITVTVVVAAAAVAARLTRTGKRFDLVSYGLYEHGWNATHVVRARLDARIDGHAEVLESLKGDLETGDRIFVAELSALASPDKRQLSEARPPAKQRSRLGTGKSVLLFLTETSKEKRAPSWGDGALGGCGWIEDGNVYHFSDYDGIRMIPGELYWSGTEDDVLARTRHVLTVRSAFDAQKRAFDAARTDRERAAAIGEFAHVDIDQARREACSLLERCGDDAIPVLAKILDEDETAYSTVGENPSAVVAYTMSRASPRLAGEALTRWLERELVAWKQLGPALKRGWYDDGGAPVMNRYWKLTSVLGVLASLKPEGCGATAHEFRRLYDSLPSPGHDGHRGSLGDAFEALDRVYDSQ
jgi:hypothetical protein